MKHLQSSKRPGTSPVSPKHPIAMLLMAGTAAMAASAAFAHSPFVQKDGYLTKDGRSYLEGRSDFIAPALGHACGAGTATTNVSVTIPSNDAEVYDLTLNATGGVAADPVPSALLLSDVLTTVPIAIKPETDNDWEMIMVKTSAANLLQALHWHGGFVPDNQTERLNMRATFAKFKPESCVSKVRIYMPLAQFCATVPGGAYVGAHYWLWASVPDAGITVTQTPPAGFTKVVGNPPFVDLDRDLEMNPLQKHCMVTDAEARYDAHNDHNSKPRPGLVLGIYPQLDTIKTWQKITDATGGGTGPTECPPGFVLVHDMETMTNSCVAAP